jgi:OmpA-OmpF porin, OOP family
MARVNIGFGVFSYLPVIFFFLSTIGNAQTLTEDSLVQFSGYVYNKENNEPIKARITYEKLPYGDDYGIAGSDSTGRYSIMVILNRSYSFTIKAEGFNSLKESVKIEKLNIEDRTDISKDFYLTPGGVGQIIRLKNLYFEQSTSDIPEQAFPEINMIVRMLKENPNMVIQLEGHTDFRGNSKLNYDLSEQRVEAIKRYIYSQGVDKKRIKLKSFGGSMPLSRENTDEAKKANRRVEVRVLAI